MNGIKPLSRCLALAFGGSLALASASVYAQDAQKQERIEVTGSSIKRIDAESAVPVIVIKRADIERSGATSVVDLLQKLPSIQGSTGESASVGGGTFGFSGVSVHDIGETRTLVLLNGHRLALFGGQTLTGFAAGFDLNAIPVSAIERVEVLTDGASALYGADAVAGVVNFITKRNSTEGIATVGYSAPQGGAREFRVSVTKGIGSLDKDGFNVLLSAAHDERTKLNSTDREFAKSGRINFSNNGKNYRIQQFSASPIPANVLDDSGNLINPYLIRTGACPDKTFRVTDGTDDYCGFNFVGELEIFPERKRDALFGGGTLKLGEHELFADLLWSRTQQTARIAPVPGSLSIPAGSPLFNTYLAPIGITKDTLAFYRVYDLGKRTNDDKAEFIDLALGSRGTIAEWDYEARYTHSQSKVEGNTSGYPGALALRRVRASGLLDPFVLPGQQSAAAVAALNSVNYKGYWDGGQSDLDTIFVRGSRELAKLAGGGLQIGTGLNVNREKFQSKPSLFAQGKLSDPVAGTLCDPAVPSTCDQRFGDSSTTVPYGANRTSWGVYGELVAPVIKELELTAAFRHDHYSDFGNADTAKASFRWNAVEGILVRGSAGTGYHAPTVPQINAATQPFGVTSGKYSCTATPALQTLATSLGALCRPGAAQYDVIAGGNAKLQAEKSYQSTLGIRFEPAQWLSAGIDLWHVAVRDAFGTLPEATVFDDPLKYPGSWSTNTDVGTGKTYLAFKNLNVNLGKEFHTGVDVDVTVRNKTPIGDLSTQFFATYIIREVSQQLFNGPYYNAVGDFNNNVGGPTFRYQGKLSASLTTGSFTNTLGVNFKSGYKDKETTVDVLDAQGAVVGSEDLRINVPFYATWDLQSKYEWKATGLSLTLGVLNLGDRKPPLSISTSGNNRSQAFGYDDRFYDPRGRTFYADIAYKF